MGRAENDRKRDDPNTDTPNSDGGTDSAVEYLTGRAQQSRLDLVVAIDASGSMALPFSEDRTNPPDTDETPTTTAELSKIEWVSEALSTVVSHLEEEDRFGIVCYNNEAKTIHQLNETKSYDLDEVQSTILQCDVYGGANLCSGIEKAVDVIGQREGRRSKHVLFVSDSLPSASPKQSPFVNRVREVTENGIDVTFVGLDSEPSPECNDTLAEIDGVTQQYITSSEELLRM